MHADGGPKAALDFERMRTEAQETAQKRWDNWHEFTKSIEAPQSWASFIARRDADPQGYTIGDARRDYHNQPAMKALAAMKGDTAYERYGVSSLGADPAECFAGTEQEFLDRARASAVPGFALLDLNGNWHEPGQMGWWGISTDTAETRAAYYEGVNDYLDNLADNVIVVCVDVHI